jgi:hypothetical protein
MYCAIGVATYNGIFASNTQQHLIKRLGIFHVPHAAQCIAPYGLGMPCRSIGLWVGVNRGRKIVEKAVSFFRHEKNKTVRQKPDGCVID